MKFLVPNYSCLQNPWLGGYGPQIPVLSVLNWICWTPPPNKIPGYATVYNNAADLRDGQSNPFDIQRLSWLVKFPTHSWQSLTLSPSLSSGTNARNSDTKPPHTGNRNGVSLVDDPGFESQHRQEIFLFFKSRRSALRSTHIPIQLVPRSLPGAKTAGACSQWRTQDIFSGGGSTNSVEDRGQRERGSGGGSPLIWRQL